MKNLFRAISIMTLFLFISLQTVKAQDKMEPWPGVKIKVLTDNDHVKIMEITMAPGSVADWHAHPQFTTYAVTDGKMQVELQGQEPKKTNVKAGQAAWSPALSHKVTNLGKTPLIMILTEIKEMK
jgi:quercetin dioxygenase-like cupin family protein